MAAEIRGTLMYKRREAEAFSGETPSEPRIIASMADVAVGDMVRIADTAEYLEDILAPMTYLESLDVGRHDSWKNLLSGDTKESMLVSSTGVNVKRCFRETGAERDRSILSIHDYVKGPDYNELRKMYPNERYKFYHSIVNQERGEEYVKAVMQAAMKAGISLSMKTMDHTYDNPNFYTWHPKKLAEIISRLQPDYADAFGETEHFLQGAVSGVNEKHVGWVQEPIRGGTGPMLSHSNRMGIIGAELDSEGRSENAYREGCAAASVRSDAPWLLAGNPATKSSKNPLGMGIEDVPAPEGKGRSARFGRVVAGEIVTPPPMAGNMPGKLRMNMSSKGPSL